MRRYCPKCGNPMILADFRFIDGYREWKCLNCGLKVSNGFETKSKEINKYSRIKAPKLKEVKEK